MTVVPRASLCLLAAVATLVASCGENSVTTKTELSLLPTPIPSETPDPVQRPVPTVSAPESYKSYEPGDSIFRRGDDASSGGGVSGGGPSDDAAVARIEAQFPLIQGDIPIGGAEAIDYIEKLGNAIPGLPQLTAVTKVTNCAFDYGVVGVKVYITPTFSRAGGIVVISEAQMQQLATLAARCFIKEVTGGGATGFEPCFESYSIVDVVNQVTDRYYIFVGGTNGTFCELVKTAHRNFNPQQLNF